MTIHSHSNQVLLDTLTFKTERKVGTLQRLESAVT